MTVYTHDPISIMVTVNGQIVELNVSPMDRLTTVLRTELGLTGTKVGCDAGDCGACSILVDNQVICACLMAAAQADGRQITTVEGLGSDPVGRRLQQSFLDYGAAQCGICTPGMLMSARALLATKPAPKASEISEALGGVLCRCTGYQKIRDAVLSLSKSDTPTTSPDPLAGQAVGQPIQRLDGLAKVEGRDLFGADVVPGDALLIKLVRSPHHHATFSLGDLDQFVAAHPGIVKVLTAGDVPGENRFGVIPGFVDQPVFAEQVTRFKGEAVAAIIGEPAVIKGFSLTSFPISWKELPALLTMDEAKAVGGIPVHQDREDNVLTSGKVVRGNAEAGFAEADIILERTVETTWVEHAYIEPEAGFACRIGDRLDIHTCTQAPFMNRESLATIMGLTDDQIRIVPTAVGGGFGAKLDLTTQAYTAIAAWILGGERPVALVYSRPESMMASTKRHPAAISMRGGVKHNGQITSLTFDGDFNTGAYASWGPTVANRVPIHASGPYHVTNYRAEARAIHTHGPVAGAFRGFGVPQAALAQETLFDQLADAIGMDRLDFRVRNALDHGMPTVTGQVFFDGVGIKACLEALRPHWERARREAATAPSRGVGLACCWYGCGNTALSNPSTIKLGLHRDGQVVLFQGAVDIGQGSSTVVTQIAADALGLPIRCFRLENANTDQTPDAGKTSASRQTFVSGNAARLAGRSLRQNLLRRGNASEEAELDLLDGVLTIREANVIRTIELATVQADDDGFVAYAQETYDPPTTSLDEEGQGEPYAVFGYGAHLVELDVDQALGTVRLDRLTAAHDVGKAINPMLVEGQVEGGVAQGMGLALMENYLPGRTENLHDYLVPTMGDMPRIETLIIEEPASVGPFGAKGLGEHVLIPTAPAILNAIRDATGAVIDRLPATPDRVLAAIQAAGGKSNSSFKVRP